MVTWSLKLSRGLIYLKRPLLEILEVSSRLKMNFTIYTDPGPSPVCLKVAENSEVLKLLMKPFQLGESLGRVGLTVFLFFQHDETGWCGQCDFKPSRSTSSNNLVDSKDKFGRREVVQNRWQEESSECRKQSEIPKKKVSF